MRPAKLPKLIISNTPNQSDRGSEVRLVVVHKTEGGYEGSVSWLKNTKAQASAHVVVNEDGSEATQIVPWNKKAWACMAFNGVSDNIELAGYSSDFMVSDQQQLRVAARIVAFRLKKRGLPSKWARNGNGKGFCRHYDLGAAGGGHHDPTMSATKWLKFCFWVKFEYLRGGFRETWGIGDQR